jgi:hypothetical protein
MTQELVDPKTISKRQRGMRLNGNLTPAASQALDDLERIFDIGKYANISAALIVYARLMQGQSIGFINPQTNAHIGNAPIKMRETRSVSKTTQAVEELKNNWCESFGGKAEGGVCTFDKYEVTLAGVTEKAGRQIALRDMPNDKDAFKKLMLGPYDNKYEAERAIDRGL